MKVGTLVVRRNRWSLDARQLGIVVSKTDTASDTWLVLWATKSSYLLREHWECALIELDAPEDEPDFGG